MGGGGGLVLPLPNVDQQKATNELGSNMRAVMRDDVVL